MSQIISKILSLVQNPCENGGTFVNDINTGIFKCSCSGQYEGDNCEFGKKRSKFSN